MSKKIVLIVGIIAIVFLSLLAYIQSGEICYSQAWCNKQWDNINLLGEILFIFIPVLLFSLITYKMREEVFRAWWNFARWFVPVIILVTLLINSQSGGGMGIGGAISGAFDTFVIGIFYAAFIVTSLVKIIRAYRRAK